MCSQHGSVLVAQVTILGLTGLLRTDISGEVLRGPVSHGASCVPSCSEGIMSTCSVCSVSFLAVSGLLTVISGLQGPALLTVLSLSLPSPALLHPSSPLFRSAVNSILWACPFLSFTYTSVLTLRVRTLLE